MEDPPDLDFAVVSCPAQKEGRIGCGWRELLRSTGHERGLRLSHRGAVSFQSEKRGVPAARNGPSEDRKCRQRVELGIYGLNRWTVKCLDLSRKRGVQAAGNAPSEDRKCWQGIELGVSGLRSWGCNLSRKVRATRSSSLCSAHLARITRCKFLQPSSYLCQFMYLTTVKRVLRNSFDLNYLRKMCGTWVQAARLPLEPGGTGSKVSYRSHHAQRSG